MSVIRGETEEGRRGLVGRDLHVIVRKLRCVLHAMGTHGNVLSCGGSLSSSNTETVLKTHFMELGWKKGDQLGSSETDLVRHDGDPKEGE